MLEGRRIPVRTVERLTLYRRVLRDLLKEGTVNVFSHQLAERSNNSSAQVRRDLMSIDFNGGSPKSGYPVKDLLACVGAALDAGGERPAALVGLGNLGRAVLSYVNLKHQPYSVAASFDIDPAKAGKTLSGCPCYHVDALEEVLRARQIRLGIITVPAAQAQEVAERMVGAGVTGILNFAPIPLRLPKHVFTDSIDITTSLEKIAYFALR